MKIAFIRITEESSFKFVSSFPLQSPHRGGRSSSRQKADPHWSPYGCHYYPDPTDFPDPDPASLPEEPLRPGEQYFLDLGGKIRKGPVGSGYTCYCAPIIDR